jgi:hypothetical protein
MDIRALIAAAIYDFAAQLTVRPEPITAGSSHDAAPMAEAVSAFLKLRNVDTGLKDPPIKTWEGDALFAQAHLDSLKETRVPLCFREELEQALNKWGMDTTYGMPDHILATLIINTLDAHGKATAATERHNCKSST